MKKNMSDHRVQATFKRQRRNNTSLFILSQDYYKLPKKIVHGNGNIYHIFTPNKLRYVQNLYQDKVSMAMTFTEFKYLTYTCWDKKYKILTIDMTKNKYTGRYRLGLNSIFVPHSSPFNII